MGSCLNREAATTQHNPFSILQQSPRLQPERGPGLRRRPGETLRTDPQVFEVLVDSFVANAMLWSFALVGAIAAFWPFPGTDSRQVRRRREAVLVAITLVSWVVVLNKFYWQHYTPALPFVAILAGGALIDVLHRHRVALGCVLLFTYAGPGRNAVLAVMHNSGGQINGFKRTLALTQPGDLVIDTRQNYDLVRPDPPYSGFVQADGRLCGAFPMPAGERQLMLGRVRP